MQFKSEIVGDYTGQPTIYKLTLGSKFLIWKGKSLRQSVDTLCRDIDRLIGRTVPDDHLLSKAIEYVTRHRIVMCKAEALFQTDDLAELINYERDALINSKENTDCLNVNLEPHIPKWIGEAMSLPAKVDMEPVTEEITPASNKAITDTFIPSGVPIPAIAPETPAKPKESLAERARRIADTMEKLKNQNKA